jgi:alcohol dehydrogenase
MKAAIYDRFGGPIRIETAPDPTAPDDGVVLKVLATGLCRSDWHGWQGHELVGTIAATGRNIRRFRTGQRVTMPFVAGCGCCEPCLTGNQQVCDRQFQPGFTHWEPLPNTWPSPTPTATWQPCRKAWIP